MLKQKLRILILQQLAHEPTTGYGLIKDIHEATGWKPSYGSIYPELEHMREEGLVTFKEEGKKKIYTLTKKGKTTYNKTMKKDSALFRQMSENLKLMSHMMGMKDEDHNNLIALFADAVRKNRTPFKEIMPALAELKLVFWQLHKDDALKKHSDEINSILKEATQKMKRLQA